MKRVVSVSLGSSIRDKSSIITVLGEEFEVSRTGTDGDMVRYAEMMRELDGKADAIGLGGIDRYLWVDDRRYTFRDAEKLARNAKVTPVVDGSGVKNTLERKTIEYMQSNGIMDFASSRVLVVSGVDRFGMAQALAEVTENIIFGDLIFACKIPVPLKSYAMLRVAATVLLPIVVRLPFKWFYPTGKEQETTTPKYRRWYQWADVIAGDWHLIRRTIPPPESGTMRWKTVITNTLTDDDMRMLKECGVRMVVTSSPAYDGRHFATNVFEGILISILGKKPEDVTVDDYNTLLARMNWSPVITEL